MNEAFRDAIRVFSSGIAPGDEEESKRFIELLIQIQELQVKDENGKAAPLWAKFTDTDLIYLLKAEFVHFKDMEVEQVEQIVKDVKEKYDRNIPVATGLRRALQAFFEQA